MFLLGLRQRVFQNVQRHRGFFLADDQRA